MNALYFDFLRQFIGNLLRPVDFGICRDQDHLARIIFQNGSDRVFEGVLISIEQGWNDNGGIVICECWIIEDWLWPDPQVADTIAD